MSDLSPKPALLGRMTIEFYDNGSGRPTPSITFDPVGRITSGLIDHYLPFICGHIEQAQARVRHGIRNDAPAVVAGVPTEPTSAPSRRRRA